MNSPTATYGHFSVLQECVACEDELKIEVRVTIIDQYEGEHVQLPLYWTYVREKNYWYLEPRSFANWTE